MLVQMILPHLHENSVIMLIYFHLSFEILPFKESLVPASL